MITGVVERVPGRARSPTSQIARTEEGRWGMCSRSAAGRDQRRRFAVRQDGGNAQGGLRGIQRDVRGPHVERREDRDHVLGRLGSRSPLIAASDSPSAGEAGRERVGSRRELAYVIAVSSQATLSGSRLAVSLSNVVDGGQAVHASPANR